MMNADLKRVRDSSNEDGYNSPINKKRALSVSTPLVDTTDDDDKIEDWMRVVEVRRKEAIYRQMLEYRRSYEAEARRAHAVEEQKRVLEASVQAVEICWTQLVNTVRDLMGRAEADTMFEDVSEPILEPTISQPSLDKALKTRLPQTKQMIKQFRDLASRNGGLAPSTEDLSRKCQRLQVESSTLRANSTNLQKQIDELTESRDGYRKDLQRAQKALDRQRMEFDKAEMEWRESGGGGIVAGSSRDRANGTPGVKSGEKSGNATPNGKIEEDTKPFPNGPPAGLLQDTSELEHISASRLKQVQQLLAERTSLSQELDKLRQTADHPSESALRGSPWFQIYLSQLATQTSRANAFQSRYETSERSLDNLRNTNAAFRDAIIAEEAKKSDALAMQVGKLHSDLARLRGQRDDMNAELTERRMREVEKMRWGDEMEGLAKAREERIGFLQSEVLRLKGKLGAECGGKDYLGFLRGQGGIDGDYIKDLERRVADAEGKAQALAAQLQESPDKQAEAGVRIELEKLQRSLERYERILGPDSFTAEDVTVLAKKLESAEKENSTLKLQLQEAEASTNALYTEVEGLSKLWDGLERTLSTKVFELKDGELKMSRLTTEKAKADNKYFQAMRSKEAIEAECKAAQRTVEKQIKLLERAQEVERALHSSINTSEKVLTNLKNEALGIQTALAAVTAEKTALESRLSISQTSLVKAQELLEKRVVEANSEKEQRIKLQEEVEVAGRQVKKLKERQEKVAASGGGTSANELQMEEQRDKLLKLLRCSCCEQNFKQQVIVKCMHTFCKQCLEDRIASRQRKCPACGLSFAKEDVQTLYWQ